MRVLVNGRPVREYSKDGAVYCESRQGTTYTIKLNNDNPYRVMVVVSVDGLDVVSGKNAAETDTGYIIEAYDSLEIKGYRINDNDCASFIFTSRGKSYVQNIKGDARNCGVIGLRAFCEKITYAYSTNIVPLTYTTIPPSITVTDNSVNAGATYTTAHNVTSYNCSVDYTSLAPSSCGGVLRSLNFDTGTGWGNKIEQSVTRVNFEKGSMLTEMTVYYASMDALEEMGVDTKPKPKVVAMPQAFGYCTPPKGWNG